MNKELQKELDLIDEFFSNLTEEEFEKILDDAMPKAGIEFTGGSIYENIYGGESWNLIAS